MHAKQVGTLKAVSVTVPLLRFILNISIGELCGHSIILHLHLIKGPEN